MKNVTITINENLVQWAKVVATKNNKSLSKFIVGLLENLRSSIGDESEVLEGFRTFAPRAISNSNERAFNREDIYDRSRIS